MLKLLVLINLIVIISPTVNPYLISQVDASPATSSPSSDDDDDDDDDDNDGSDPQDDSPQDDSKGTDSSSDGSGDDDDNDNGFEQTGDEQNPIGGGDGASVDEEPPTSTERGGNPLEGLNLRNLEKEKADCDKYLKSLGGSDGTNVGDTIENLFETKEEYCKRILGGAGIDILNTTMTTTSEPMNQTGLTNNNNSTEGDIIITEEGTPSPCIIIREEGVPSGPSQPQPQPSPTPC